MNRSHPDISQSERWLIVGQGLAGTCLALEFLDRGIPFRIVDSGRGGSSRVAAGMINPITGRNFEPSWLIEDFHPGAVAFFERAAKTFGEPLWHPLPVMRLASSAKEWAKISNKLDLPKTKRWLHETQATTPDDFCGSITLKGGGWVNTARFLSLTRDHFEQLGILETAQLDTTATHSQRILCQGAQGLLQDQLGKHRCAKGEILTVEADWPETHIRIGAGGWLIPIGQNRFRIGSTYEWNELDELPTDKGTTRISEIASKLGSPDFKIIDHVAGVRPILRRSQPLIGKNTGGDWVFNALGSKGTLYAPGMATMLADWICNGTQPDPEFILNISEIAS